MTRHRINYTREFKLAILARIDGGVSIAQVARGGGYADDARCGLDQNSEKKLNNC